MKVCSSWRIDGAVGLPEDQPAADLLVDGEEVELPADHAVVPLLGFLQLLGWAARSASVKKAVP